MEDLDPNLFNAEFEEDFEEFDLDDDELDELDDALLDDLDNDVLDS